MSGPSFRDLDVWQVAMQLADRVYEVTRRFPRHELYGLARQNTARAKAYHDVAANGSAAELETQLELTRRRNYAPEADIRTAEGLFTRAAKMLFRLIASADEEQRRATNE